MRVWLPLRVKLTAWALAIFLGVNVAVSGGLLAIQWADAQRDLDAELRKGASEAVTMSLEQPSLPDSRDQLDRIAHEIETSQLLRRYAVLLRDERGVLVSSSSLNPDLQRIDVPAPPVERAGDFRFETVEVPLSNGARAELRVVTTLLPDELGRKFRLQLAARAPWTKNLSEMLLELVGTSTIVGLFASGTAAWFLAGRAVAPIQRMARAARAVSPEALETRLDVNPRNAELASLERELNSALARLEEGYRAQGMFISNVSHELKTPIAVLLSQAQILKQGDHGQKDLARFATTVEEEMRTLGRLVESFLVLARTSHGEDLVRRERAALNDLVLEAAERCAPLARENDVPLVTKLHLDSEHDSGPEVDGDPELLRTMVENLLRNAIRFSPRGASIDLALQCTEREAEISVRDRGPGIAAEWIGRIFEPFVQAPQATRHGRGSGLGLAIARSVAERHGGTISAANAHGGGARFVIRLPLANGESTARAV